MEDSKKVLDFYAQRWGQYRYDTRSLGIGSRESQEARFRVLAEIGDLRGASILDVGCGFGDLLSFLEGQGISARYTGIDIQPPFIQEARTRHPAAEFLCTGIEEFPADRRFDYVLVSGTFNVKFREDQEAWVFRVLRKMFALAERGVGINLLSTYHDEGRFREDMFYCPPERAFSEAHNITRWVTLRHDYMPHDFTLYLYRKG